MGRHPEASGSSVPAWPARLQENSRLIAPTTCVDVMPIGLSTTIQPWTSRFSRRNCCLDFFPGDGPATSPSRGEATASAARDSLLIAVLALEVALDRRCSQQLLDPFRFVESLVGAESNLGSKFQVDVVCDLAAQIALVAVQRLDHLFDVAAAERHHVD